MKGTSTESTVQYIKIDGFSFRFFFGKCLFLVCASSLNGRYIDESVVTVKSLGVGC